MLFLITLVLKTSNIFLRDISNKQEWKNLKIELKADDLIWIKQKLDSRTVNFFHKFAHKTWLQYYQRKFLPLIKYSNKRVLLIRSISLQMEKIWIQSQRKKNESSLFHFAPRWNIICQVVSEGLCVISRHNQIHTHSSPVIIKGAGGGLKSI